MAAAAKGKEKAGKPSKAGAVLATAIPVLLLTLVAAGGGWLIGTQINAARGAPTPAAAKVERVPDTMAVRELPPVLTNLAAPEGAWVRLQTAIIYDKSDSKDITTLATQIADDTMAFVKTLTVTQLQGSSGLQHLREDLNERAALRSDGKVKELIIETLVVE